MDVKQKKIYMPKMIERSSTFARSPVNIIVPFHGQYEKVSRLVNSILQVTRSNPYQICLVDDASPNPDYINEFTNLIPGGRIQGVAVKPQIVTVRSERQLGFGGALALGMNATEEPWVVFMHSDCVVEDPRWLIELGRFLIRNRSSNVRMVAPRTNNPGDGADSRLVAERNESGEDIILGDGVLPLYCAMCHRDLFRHIGGFIKAYPYHFYEDEELAFRMRHYGFRQGICGTSWVRHDGGATINELCEGNPFIQKIVAENRNRCITDMRLLLR